MDTDLDGVFDDVDNCVAIGNADQHDEDDDDIGDPCDPCPQVGAPQADGDTDGIGDECDPNPAVSGDVLVRFEGFGAASAFPSGWTASPAGSETAWSLESDELVISRADAVN